MHPPHCWSLCKSTVPEGARGVVLLAQPPGRGAQGDGVAAVLLGHRFAVLRIELLQRAEAGDAEWSSDLALLGGRWEQAIAWVAAQGALVHLPLGLFASGADAAAALYMLAAGTHAGQRVAALVCGGGRLELLTALGLSVREIDPPTLLLVGADDAAGLRLHRQALQRLACKKRLEAVPGAGSRFDQHGADGVVSELAGAWFDTHLAAAHAA